ncbi:MAG: hypothetical protein Q9202_004733 [Teloschistes flavicans]
MAILSHTLANKPKKAMKTEWKCLIGVGPGTEGVGERDMTVIHNTRYSFLILSQPDRVFFFVFVRLDNPFTWPKRDRYTDEDAEKLAASVTPNIALGGNSSMESVVVLCNHLRQMMVHQCGARPSPATLRNTVAAHQDERKPRMKHIMEYSSLITSVQA